MKTLVLPLALLSVFTACGSQPDLDIGDETSTTGQALSDYAANWDGYGEAFAVAGDGSDRVRISIDENGEGTVRFGEELRAPATDPNGSYPTSPWMSYSLEEWVWSGVEYPILDAQVTASRLRFGVEVGALMESWCAIQPPEPIPGWICGSGKLGGYHGPVGQRTCEAEIADNTFVPIDCDVYFQCGSCQCDTERCHAVDQGVLKFDAALTNGGDSMEGTMLMLDGARVTVRLAR